LTTSAAEDMGSRKRAVDNVVVVNGADSTRVGKEVALTKTCANGRGENSPRRKSATPQMRDQGYARPHDNCRLR